MPLTLWLGGVLVCGTFSNVFDIMTVFINCKTQVIDILWFITPVQCRNIDTVAKKTKHFLFLGRIYRTFVHTLGLFHFPYTHFN